MEARMAPQFAQRYRFDLPDAFSRDAENFAGFLERMRRVVANAKPHADDLFFTGRESRQHFLHRLSETCFHQGRLRTGSVLVP